MGLAASQARLLTLTARKGDCEYGISIRAMEKMSLANDQSQLSSEYYSKLKAAKIAFYSGGQYQTMNYNYLMGYQSYTAVTAGDYPLKTDNSMILTDASGRVVLSNNYVKALQNVLGSSCMDANGRGGTFSADKIPEILAQICTGFSVSDFKSVIDNKNVEASSYAGQNVDPATGESKGSTTVDNTDSKKKLIQKVVDFYYPIFHAAAANGWTSEYNEDIAHNPDYISDSLLSGTLQLAQVDENGGYAPDASLTYFTMSGLVEKKNDSQAREEITAWYNQEKERLTEKENFLDLEIRDLSTELEAINTEMQSLQSLIDNAVQTVFDWGGGS